eukprot:4195403-Karenia_brevis.AAC.1
MRESEATGRGLLVSGKMQRLEREFHNIGLDLIGGQETRIPADVDIEKEHYNILGSSATSAGTHGVQLWVARSLRANALEVRPLTHRILFVALQ